MLFFVNNTNAQSVRVRLPDTTGLIIGNIVEIPVYIDSTLTGKNITSYQFSILFSGALSSFTFLDISTTGTVSSTFGTPIYSFGNYPPSPSYKLLQVAAAGTSPLIGKGKLFNIRMRIVNSGGIYSQFLSNSSCIFNQGSPSLILINGTWYITPRPKININLNGLSPLTIGDSVNVNVSGGLAPYILSFITGNIGTISSNTQYGNTNFFIKGSNVGKSRIRIVDANNNIDTTDSDLEVVANKLRISDTTILPQSFITIPIKINSVTGQGVLSGSIAISYNPYLRVDSVLLGNTVLQNSVVQWNNVIGQSYYNNTFYLSFANASALTGSGDFVKIRFRVLSPNQTSLIFTNVTFNQNTKVAVKNASIIFTSIPQLSIYPNGMQLVAGDSIKLNISGGRKPYQFSLNNTTIASLDTSLYLKAKSSGNAVVSITDSLGAVLNSNIFKLFDANLTLASVSALPNSWVEVPIFIDKLPVGKSVNSYQLLFNINQSNIDSLVVINANTLSNNFNIVTNYSNNIFNVVAASANSISQSGILFKLRFKLKSSVNVGNTIYLYLNSHLMNEGNVNLKDNSNSAVSIVNLLQKDIRVESILNLSSSCSKSSNESLTVRLYNSGNFNFFIGDKIKVGYKLNNLNFVYDTVTLTSNFNSGNRVDFTFKNKLNLSNPGQYSIKSFSQLVGDINTANDTSVVNFQVFGIPSLKLQNDTSVCSGNSITLSSNLTGTFLWSTGSTSSSINVSTTGNYSLIFTSSNNCIAYDTVSVTILPSQSTPVITANGSLSFCEGDSVTLNTNAINNIQWLRNGIIIPTATFQSIVIKASGIYTIRSSAYGFCDAISLPTTINVFTKPAKPIITNNTNDSLCIGSSSLLQSSFVGTAKWYRNGLEILNATSNTYLANQTGSYTIKVTNASNCIAESDTFKLAFINNPDTATISANITESCVGDTLTITSDISSNIAWYFNDNIIQNSQNAQSIEVTNPGIYKVVSTNSLGCTSSSNSININFNQNPNKPSITQSSNILTSTSANAYQWYLNDTILNGANQQTLTIFKSGIYKVDIKNQFNCSSISDDFNATFSGIFIQKNNLNIFPNPANDYFRISGLSYNSENIVIIYDIYGKLLETLVVDSSGIVNISKLETGAYIIKFNNMTSKIIKM